MKSKRYSPAVLEAVSDALTKAYWYKNDLRTFLQRTDIPPKTLGNLDWHGVKRRIVDELLTELATTLSGMSHISAIIDALIDQDGSFPHLQRIQGDGPEKARDAANAQSRLGALLRRDGLVEKASKVRAASQVEHARRTEETRKRQSLVSNLNLRFLDLAKMSDPRQRGRDFEVLLYDLFSAYDLEPRRSYGAPGEQTDGSIRIDGKTLLVEARWEKNPSTPRQIREFRAKVQDKLETTLGLYISMAGFTDEAVNKAADGGRRLLILMQGEELASILQGVIDLPKVLLDKLRHAAETGEAYYRAH